MIPSPLLNKSVKPPFRQCGVQDVVLNCLDLGLPLPVLALPLWEGAGNKVYDVSGNSNHGDFVNNPTWDGEKIKFDVGNDYIESSVFSTPTDRTISVIFNTSTNFSTSSAIFGDDRKGIIRFEANDKVTCYAYDDVTYRSVESLTVLNDGKDHHLIFVIKGSDTIKMYVDGVFQSTAAFGVLSGLKAFNAKIGANYSTSNNPLQYFDGSISAVSIFNAALSPEQIKTFNDDPYGIFKSRELNFSLVGSLMREGIVHIPEQNDPNINPRWNAPVGVIESRVAYNCRTHGFPRPVLALPMWEGAGNKCYDVSGHGNHSIPPTAFQPTWESEGLYFESGHTRAMAIAKNSGAPPDSLTFSGTDEISIVQHINGKDSISNEWCFTQSTEKILRNSNNKAEFILNSFSSNDRVSSVANIPDKDVTIAGVFDGTDLHIYLDGVGSSVTPTGTYSNPSNPMLVGGYSYSGTQYNWEGIIYTTLIFDVGLTPEQIQKLTDDPYCLFRPIEPTYAYQISPVGLTGIPPHDNPKVKPKWNLPVGVMEGIVAYNCRTHGFPRPVLALPMWEGAGNKCYDVSGYGNHGSLKSTTSWEGEGLNFDGISDYVGVDLFAYTSDEITIFAEINPDIWYGGANEVELVRLKNVFTFTIRQPSGGNNLRFYIWDTSSPKQAVCDVSGYTGRHMVCASYNGSNIKLFVDGNEKVSTAITGNIPNRTDTLYIGSQEGTDEFLAGGFNSLLIFNVALSPEQIKTFNDDPYFMFRVPDQLAGSISVITGLIELAAIISTSTIVGDAEAKILREISISIDTLTNVSDIDLLTEQLIEFATTIATTSNVGDSQLRILREIITTIQSQSNVSDTTLKILRELSLSIDSVTDISDINLLISGIIELVTSINTITLTSDIQLKILRELLSSIDTTTSIDDITLITALLIEFATTITTSTLTSDAELKILRELAAVIESETSISDITIPILRELVSTIESLSDVSDINLLIAILIELSTSINTATVISDLNINMIRDLATSIDTESSVSDVAINIVRALSAAIETGSSIDDANLLVLREFSASIDSETLISAITLVTETTAYIRSVTSILDRSTSTISISNPSTSTITKIGKKSTISFK